MNRAGNVAESTGERRESLMKPFTRFQDRVRRASTRIAIKVKGGIRFINSSDVVAVVADGNYVLLQEKSSSYLLRESISVVAEKLEPFGFVRIHRSVIVNSAFVQEIQPYRTGEYGLRVKAGKEYTVTRTYRANLKFLAEFWIGSRAFSGRWTMTDPLQNRLGEPVILSKPAGAPATKGAPKDPENASSAHADSGNSLERMSPALAPDFRHA